MNKKILRWNFVFQYGYVLTNIFNSVLLLPLYLKKIDANTLGIWLATGNILSWMTLVDPGVGEVLQQKIAELRGKKFIEEINQTIGSGFIASAIILLISIIIGFIFYFLLGLIIDKDVSKYPHLPMALMISIGATGLSLVSFSLSGINQGLHNAADVAISSLCANFLFLFTNLAFLYWGFGVMSIAIANITRALFINIYNITSMMKLLKKEELSIEFSRSHFKRFIKIFSFTSLSKIISGLSSSIDMVILARFIPASMITVYEINKRPVKITQSLIGRHSVALMPTISHAKGLDDKEGIVRFINRQFKFYAYATIFTCFIFMLNYHNLITAWTGPGKYAGDYIMYLLVAIFFFNLVGYFMSNMGYALGDIKNNSLVNIVRGVIVAALMFVVAGKYGIIGTLWVSLGVMIFTDFFYFTYRLYKIGYLETFLVKNTLVIWSVLIPASAVAGWGITEGVNKVLTANMYLTKVFVTSTFFTIIFALLLFICDSELRIMLKAIKVKWQENPPLKRFRFSQ